jgi:glyoxylase-like metal-dependent hydrolase (beta-lactamase superfamily II)
MITLGDHTIVPVLDSVVRRDPAIIFSKMPASAWEGRREHLARDGRIELFLGGYVVRSGERVVLVDAGVGPGGYTSPVTGAVMPGGFLTDNLRVAGIALDAVTDVVFTHLHPDHIGWASQDGLPVFANATYRCSASDWRYFVEKTEDETAVELLAPIASRFEMWDGPSTLCAGIDLLPAPGHTPGSTIVVLSANSGGRAMLLGDVVHCPVQLLEEEWQSIGDVDPQLAQATRVRLARELEGSETLVGAAHFPELRFGRLLVGANKRRWTSLR